MRTLMRNFIEPGARHWENSNNLICQKMAELEQSER